MNNLSSKIYKLLKYIYILILISIILLSIKKDILLSLGLIIISLLLLLFLNKKSLNKKSFIIICLIGILLRISLLFFNYLPYQNDELAFFSNASSLASLNTLASAKYISLFPYLFAYIKLLSLPFKLFGASTNSVIILNIIIDLIGAVFAFLCGKELKENNNLKLLTLWLINPFNIFWCSKCLPIIIVNTCFIICVYLFLISLRLKGYKSIFTSLCLGIMLGISNCFRPIFIIFLIAIIIYFIYLILKNKKIKKYLFLTLTIISTYFLIDIVYPKIVYKTTNFEPSTSAGWSMYLGSNIDSSGQWFEVEEYKKQMDSPNFNANKIQKYYQKKALENYKSYSFGSILKLLALKYNVLTPSIHIYTYETLINTKSISPKIIDLSIKIFIYIMWLTILLGCLPNIKETKREELLFFFLLVIGLILSHLFVEVSPRYFMPVIVPLQVIFCLLWEKT